MNAALRKKVFESLRKGQNVSVFGMETSGHNTETEKILNTRDENEYLAIVDCRKIDEYNEKDLQKEIFLSTKALNKKGKYINNFSNFDELVYSPRDNWALYTLIKTPNSPSIDILA